MDIDNIAVELIDAYGAPVVTMSYLAPRELYFHPLAWNNDEVVVALPSVNAQSPMRIRIRRS